MDEDWDLHALVRSYTTSPTTTTTISTAAAAAESDSSETREEPFGSLAILINHEEDNNNNPFHFPNLLSDPKTKYNPFEELQQLYKPFFPTAAAAVVSAAITAPLMKPPPPRLPLPPPPSPFVSELTNNGGILDRNPRAGPSSSSLSFGPRSRRRKNQQKKVVKQVTAESLSSDMWAWRKYGQKPIKGSPYPRNYYRCSSSKGCPARKQVERSNSDPNMFNITYTGEHTHPRPTHRNSLAGSTRNKFPTAATATADDDNNKNNNPENPSRFASSSLSPTTPLLIPPIMDFEVGIETNNDDDDDADVDGGDDEDEEMNGADQTVDDDDDADEEERNILIPNLAMNEDIFMGLQELTDHGLKTGIKSQPSKYTHRLSAIALAGAGKTNTISAARSGGC